MPLELKQKTGLYLAAVDGKGLGLFCSQAIEADEDIESCLAIAFNHIEAYLIDQTKLYDYYFSLSFLTDEQARQLNISDKDNSGCLALGFLSMANHSLMPNAAIKKNVQDARVVLTLKALTPISAHQEIIPTALNTDL